MAAPVAPKAPAVGRSVADHALQLAMFGDGFGRGVRRFMCFYEVANGLSSFAFRAPLETPLRIAIHVPVVGSHIVIPLGQAVCAAAIQATRANHRGDRCEGLRVCEGLVVSQYFGCQSRTCHLPSRKTPGSEQAARNITLLWVCATAVPSPFSNYVAPHIGPTHSWCVHRRRSRTGLLSRRFTKYSSILLYHINFDLAFSHLAS